MTKDEMLKLAEKKLGNIPVVPTFNTELTEKFISVRNARCPTCYMTFRITRNLLEQVCTFCSYEFRIGTKFERRKPLPGEFTKCLCGKIYEIPQSGETVCKNCSMMNSKVNECFYISPPVNIKKDSDE